MSYYAIVATLKNVRKHPNADRLQLAEVFGNTVCVNLDYTEGQLGIYFPTDGKLSVEFAEANNLLRKKDENGNNVGGYMDPDKRNVTAIKLRGEKSDGLFLPLTCLESFGDISKLKAGDRIDVFNGQLICEKYIPRTNHQRRQGHVSEGNRTRKSKDVGPRSPQFKEHADTEQLAYNTGAFKVGDILEFTLKMHGTSQRTGYLPTYQYHKRSFFDKLLRRPGEAVYDWDYVTGTRRVVLESFDKGGFYGSNQFRKQHQDVFVDKLWKGETVYYEVVGFTHTGTSIMGSGNNEKLGKDFVKQYGKETVFSYGCSPDGYTELPMSETGLPYGAVVPRPQSDIYVYRMTITNEDGEVIEYTPDFMRYRCEQMGVKTVPVFGTAIISEDRLHFTAPDGYDKDYLIGDGTIGDLVVRCAEDYFAGPDPVGKTHIREGVVVRVLNRPKFCAYKHKNFEFKVLEGLIKDTASAPDMEEAQEVSE